MEKRDLKDNLIACAPGGKGARPDFSTNEQTFSRFAVISPNALAPQMVYDRTITRRFSSHLVQERAHLSARRKRGSRTLSSIRGSEDFMARRQARLPTIERLAKMPQMRQQPLLQALQAFAEA